MSLEQKEIFENSNRHSSRIDYLNGLEFRHSSTLRDSEIQRNGNSCIFANKFINKLVVFQFWLDIQYDFSRREQRQHTATLIAPFGSGIYKQLIIAC